MDALYAGTTAPKPLLDLDHQIVEDARILQSCMNHSEEFITAPHECSSSFFVLAACTFFGQLPGLSKPNSLENKVKNMSIIIAHLQKVSERNLSHINPAHVVAQEKAHVAELLKVFLEIVCPPQHKIHAWRSNVVPPQISRVDARFAHLEAMISDLEATVAAAAKASSTAAVQQGGSKAGHHDRLLLPTSPSPIPSLPKSIHCRLRRFVQDEESAWKRVLVRHHCKEEVRDYQSLIEFEKKERHAVAELQEATQQAERREINRQHCENEAIRMHFEQAMQHLHSKKRHIVQELMKSKIQRKVDHNSRRQQLVQAYEEKYRLSLAGIRSLTERQLHISSGGDRYT